LRHQPSIEIEEVNGVPADSKLETVKEVDLSDEWANMLEEPEAPAEVAAAPAAPATADSAVEEFSIFEEAPAASTPEPTPKPVAPAAHEPEEFDIPMETPAAGELEVPAETEHVPAAPVAAQPEEIPFAIEEAAQEAAAATPAAKTPPPAPKAPEPEPEFELDQDYELVLDPEPLVPAHDQRPPDVPIVAKHSEPELVAQNAAPAAGFASDQFLSDLANEIDQLGIDELSPAFSTPANHEAAPVNNAAQAEQQVSQIEVGPLKEVFDEFRAELGEMGGEEEDLETHYNLGIAFREMGLLEEAISEFQKVAKAAERGRPFPYVMQCYTLLGLAFMDRGQPSIAAMWYERALRLPNVETESALALRYDLGVAQESAGESDAALKSFSQVYAVNIDYRDVGERIAALQKTTR
jgi:hypothetical protein